MHAQHGPDGSDDVQGPVLGFLLSAPGAETIYVSGDNASREVVRALVHKAGELAIAILNAGAVQLPKFDRAYLTLSADHAADVAKVLGARTVIPLHFEGWAHVTQGAGELKAAFRAMGSLIACSCSSADTAPKSEESNSYGCEKHRGVPSADAITVCRSPIAASDGASRTRRRHRRGPAFLARRASRFNSAPPL